MKLKPSHPRGCIKLKGLQTHAIKCAVFSSSVLLLDIYIKLVYFVDKTADVLVWGLLVIWQHIFNILLPDINKLKNA